MSQSKLYLGTGIIMLKFLPIILLSTAQIIPPKLLIIPNIILKNYVCV